MQAASRCHSRPLVAGCLLLSILLLAGCAAPGGAAPTEEPAHIELIPGSEDLHTITLTEQAAQRLDIQTIAARESEDGVVVPYSAVFYGPDGETWAYVSPQPLTFVREPIEVADVVDGAEAILSDGPAPGTEVVTVGVAELYGTEFEVGH